MKNIFYIIIVIFCTNSCDDTESNINESIPVITGIYVSTENAPDGTGGVLGSPAYQFKASDPNVYSNPSFGAIQIEPGKSISRVTFTRMPTKAKITIVRGTHDINLTKDMNREVVTVLSKDDLSRYYAWDLTDSNGIDISSGLYRAFIESDVLSETKIIDLYIIQEKDKDTWQDPTGWMNP